MRIHRLLFLRFIFFFNDTATTEIYTVPYTLSLHDALPIASPARTPSEVLAGSVSREPSARLSTRSEEHTSELQSHGTISYAVFCLKKKKTKKQKKTKKKQKKTKTK